MCNFFQNILYQNEIKNLPQIIGNTSVSVGEDPEQKRLAKYSKIYLFGGFAHLPFQ